MLSILAERNINDHIDMIYCDIVTNFPELIKTDEEWIKLKDKNIFRKFKNKYFKSKIIFNSRDYNDFALFLCLKCNINRLKNVLNNNNEIINKFFTAKYTSIILESFHLVYEKIDKDYLNNRYGLSTLLYRYIIIPVYSILIPYWFNHMRKFSKNKFSSIASITQEYFLYYHKISYSSLDKEYISNIENSVILIHNTIKQYFIQHSNEDVLQLLLQININKIDNFMLMHIMKLVRKKECSQYLLKQIKEQCLLNVQQKNVIDSFIILKNL